MDIKKITVTAILAAVLCVISPFSLPLGAVPVSLATFALYIISCTVNKKYALSAVIIYILLGAAGLPVFSFFSGGFHKIAGLTGGYILGYIPCAFVISFLTDKFEDKKFVYPLSMIAGTAACYLFGMLWYMYQSNSDLKAAIITCILPFFVGDAVKIAAASVAGINLRKRIKKFRI